MFLKLSSLLQLLASSDFFAIRLLCNVAFISGLISQQLPGQIDAFGVEALGQRSQQPEGYAALNEQLLSQLTYQLADSDKKVNLHSCIDFLKKVVLVSA